MEKPTECRWCGCRDIERESPIMQSVIVTFACGTMSDTDASGTRWLRDQRCAGPVGKLYKRIRRAIDTLIAAKRYTVTPGPRNTLDWDRNPDGSVTDSVAVDEAIAILEGERDGETWHPYLEPPSDTRSVMLRFDPAGNHDCQGFYSYDFGSYARNETSARRLKFVHPTHWRELTEDER